MKRILIVGASILQLPAILKAKEKGYLVATADRDPDAVGIPYVDKYYNVSTLDIDGIISSARDFRTDGIMTLATDMPMRAVAAATSEMGLPGINVETALKATDKGEMIEAFKYHDVESPWYFIINSYNDLRDIMERIEYPCILKPVDNAGSRGVVLVENEQMIDTAFRYAQSNSRSSRVIVEEYMTGLEVSVETITLNGKTNVLAITDKLTTGAPYFVEMGHSQNTKLGEHDQQQIKDLAIRAIEAVGINIGPAHVEVMLTEKGPRIIELGARMGGDCITSHLVPLSSGIDFVAATIELLTGFTPNITPKFNKGSAIRFFTSNGIISKIQGIEEARRINGIMEVSLMKKESDTITGLHSSADRVGYVISQANNAAEAIAICDDAVSKISIKVQ